jgi:hypothetical protein
VAGGELVVIRWSVTDEELYSILDNVNGVIFTGGAMNPYTSNGLKFLKLSRKIYNYSI